jgi:NAD(P)H-nitrite reductase large subunit
MKPRHAELFASDLSKQDLVRMIDRVLMFYVRTADRLQRTSTWGRPVAPGPSVMLNPKACRPAR